MKTLRPLLRDRTYFLLSVLTAGVSVGATVAVFTVVNALWLRPRPVVDPDRVVVLVNRSQPLDGSRFTDIALNRFRTSGLFDGVAGQLLANGLFASLTTDVTIGAARQSAVVVGVTPEYFSVLGVRPIGRDFTSQDDRYGGPGVAIISHRLWQTRFGGRLDVVGTIVPATPQPLQVIGVAPKDFQGAFTGEAIDIWLPHHVLLAIASVPKEDVTRGLPMINLCRLRPGMTPHAVQAWLAQGTRPSDANLDVVPIGRLFAAADLPMIRIGDGGLMAILAATAGLVLFGGCATLMALVLVHYERRRRELDIRVALGATRADLIKPLVLELMALAAVGAGAALLVSYGTVAVLPRLRLPGGLDLSRVHFSIDWRVVTASLFCCTVAITAAALWPILRFTRASRSSGLAGSSAAGSRGSIRLRQIVLAAHVGASVTVLIGATLVVRSVLTGFSVGPGFDASSTLFVDSQSRPSYRGETESQRDAQMAGRYAAGLQAIERIRALPGVELVALGRPPLGQDAEWSLRSLRRVQTDTFDAELTFGWRSVGPEYFTALGVKPVIGRVTGTPDELVLTASMAEALWPGESPLGRHMKWEPFAGTVVGVVELAFGSVQRGRPAAVFSFDQPAVLPLVFRGSGRFGLVIRTSDPHVLRPHVARLLKEAFPEAPSITLASGRELVAADLGRERLGAWFFAAFAAISTALGLGGVVGLVMYVVALGRRELGIMIALGATHRHLVLKTMSSSLLPTASGAAVGAGLAVWLTRGLDSLLLGMPSGDPGIYVGTYTLFTASAAIVGVVAARSVRRVSPADALRSE
jgi:putative ABC transport system permease protein